MTPSSAHFCQEGIKIAIRLERRAAKTRLAGPRLMRRKVNNPRTEKILSGVRLNLPATDWEPGANLSRLRAPHSGHRQMRTVPALPVLHRGRDPLPVAVQPRCRPRWLAAFRRSAGELAVAVRPGGWRRLSVGVQRLRGRRSDYLSVTVQPHARRRCRPLTAWLLRRGRRRRNRSRRGNRSRFPLRARGSRQRQSRFAPILLQDRLAPMDRTQRPAGMAFAGSQTNDCFCGLIDKDGDALAAADSRAYEGQRWRRWR